MMRIVSSFCVFILISTIAFSQTETTPPIQFQGVFLSDSRLETLQKRIVDKTEPTYTAFLALQRAADAQRNRECHAPQDWYVPGFYRDAEGHERGKRSLMGDANAAYQLALCYRITGDVGYAASAVRLIDGWATTVKTMSDKDDSTLSFSYHFPALIFAADLIKTFPGWPQENQIRFQKFVREKALPMNTMSRQNNWGNWGLVLVMATAAYLHDEPLMQKSITRWKEFIAEQIAEDGHLPHEVTRSEGMRGIWYTHFALMPQTLAAEIARVNGVDLYEYQSPNGRSLRQAFERIAPWTHHPATFPYYQGDPNNLTGTVYIGYFEILNSHWPNPDATAQLQSLRPLTSAHCATDLTFTHGDLHEDR